MTAERGDVALSELTTLRLGGPARRLVECASAAEIVDTVRAADAAGLPLLVLGGGSNVVVADAGFDGTVLRVVSRGVTVEPAGRSVLVRVAAGEPWPDLVDHLVAEALAGVEALAGIPGSTGATPIQNVGAYGQEVAATIREVDVWDRRLGAARSLAPAQCRFTYRHSIFKGSARFVVLGVAFELERHQLSGPLRYAELARRLGVQAGGRAPLREVRAAVLELRRAKGMVLDPADHDTWSAGSFFTNPRLEPGAVPAGALCFPEPDGKVKTSAAWLIEQAGFGRGYGAGAVRVSTRHALALTNRGGATTEDLLALAREIRAGVRARFGIELVNEPVLVGVTL